MSDCIVKIIPNDRGNPPGRLAEAELHFNSDHVLSGLKLIGFAIWERRTGNGRNVTFPARQYAVNGERRSFALLRPANGDIAAQDRVRMLILDAYAQYETEVNDGGTLTSAQDAALIAAAAPLEPAAPTKGRRKK